MHRTQIYLEEEARERLLTVAKQTGKSFSEVIREAIKDYLRHNQAGQLIEMINETHGLWRDRTDIDVRKLREEWQKRTSV